MKPELVSYDFGRHNAMLDWSVKRMADSAQWKKQRTISRNNNGLVAVLSNFDIELLNSFVKINKLTPSGRINTITASVDNLFKMSGLNATVQMDTLFLNYDDWGALSIRFGAKNINEVFKGNVALTKGKQQLLALISLFPVKSKLGENNKIIAPRFEADVDIASFPVDMIRYFIETGISEPEGEVDAKITLKGDLKRPDISGNATIIKTIAANPKRQTRVLPLFLPLLLLPCPSS